MQTKKDYIYQTIIEQLLSGRYGFGDPLQVKEISDATGASRNPIMAAMHLLQHNGFVRITAQVGCTVASPGREEVSDFYRMFAAIEQLIGEMAAARAAVAEIAELRRINQAIGALRAAQPKVEEKYRGLNVEFHLQLHEMAHSPIVCGRQFANFELSDFYLVQTGGFSAHLPFVHAEHEKIIQAIEARDASATGKAARAHIESVAKHLDDYFSTQEAPRSRAQSNQPQSSSRRSRKPSN